MMKFEGAKRLENGHIFISTTRRYFLFWKRRREFVGECHLPGYYKWAELPEYRDIIGEGISDQLNMWANNKEIWHKRNPNGFAGSMAKIIEGEI
jgi:hypothetical protein